MEQLVFGLISGLVLGIPLGAVGLVKVQQRRPKPFTQSADPLSYAPVDTAFHGEFRPTESVPVSVL